MRTMPPARSDASLNKDERLRIAEAGQARTLNEHTCARRIPELVELLESRLK